MADEKPKAKMVGEDGNVFNLMAIARRALKDAGQGDKVDAMVAAVMDSKSYTEALAVMDEYVEIE